MKPRRSIKASVHPLSVSLGLVALSRAFCQTQPDTQVEQTTYNPDPGATLRSAPQPAFYQPPPGTPPDYQEARDPLLTTPHAPLIDMNPVPPIFQNEEERYKGDKLPPFTAAVPNRWDLHVYAGNPPSEGILNIPIWRRYNATEPETPYGYETYQTLDPYKQSLLKGDLPILGQDIFLSITGNSFTSYEARDIPTPSGVSTYNSQSSQFYGGGHQQEVDQFLSMDIDLFKGEAGFQPIAWMIHLEPVYNINYSDVEEAGVLSADPRGPGYQSDNNGVFTNTVGVSNNPLVAGLTASQIAGLKPGNPTLATSKGGFVPGGINLGSTNGNSEPSSYVTRTKDFVALQEGFAEFKLADLTPNYDFVSIRFGNQPFISDFRGFIFDDTDLGVRVFGNYDSNRYQYNLAVFDMREKDTYSGLNTFDSRHQWVFAANLYRQDFFAKGYTAQVSFLTNFDNQTTHYDRNGELVDPAPIGGPIEPHDERVYYIGLNGDGHIGRFNITHSFYEAIGHDDMNGIAGHPVNINGQMAALQLSYDESWIRFNANFFYASGDDNPEGSEATGFDTIMDNPNLIGPFSYYNKQGFIFGDTSVAFKQSDSLVPDLRTSKTEGQSNFVNPGVFIYGVGTDIDVLPTMKLFMNANYITMANTASVNYALHTSNIHNEIGWDLSGGIRYRPLLTNNIILSAGVGALLPGQGYRQMYATNTATLPGYDSTPGGHVDSFLYSAFAALTLTY